MIRWIVHAATVLAATSASALTCSPPDPVRTFATAQAAPEEYVVLLGRLTFDDTQMPAPIISDDGTMGDVRDGPPDSLPAKLDGFALGQDGFTLPAPADLIVQPICLGPWCGHMPSGGTWLLFAERTAEGHVVETGPCGGWAFMDPDQATLDAVAACMRGEACNAP